uniref:Uncharacterized protein n=1 Tax=Timema douglasi TaxID=61478 RepID=A0A7R8VEU0_TIMDO|nr:unnamed protein product [Timema douglasi]
MEEIVKELKEVKRVLNTYKMSTDTWTDLLQEEASVDRGLPQMPRVPPAALVIRAQPHRHKKCAKASVGCWGERAGFPHDCSVSAALVQLYSDSAMRNSCESQPLEEWQHYWAW